jgi:imidazolonepropionase-like amidohydrolase
LPLTALEKETPSRRTERQKQKQGPTRRDLLKAAGAGTAAAATFGAITLSARDAPAASFEAQYDIVVVGGGGAGLPSALFSRWLGNWAGRAVRTGVPMSIALNNGRIVDGRGGVFVGHIVVEGDRIAAVGWGDAPAGVRRIELGGRSVLPGLIDTHVHLCLDGGVSPAAQISSETYAMTLLRAAQNSRRQIESGVTTVRDLGARSCLDPSGPGGIAYNLKQAIAAGVCPGPRIVASGLAITITGGHSHWMGRQADGADAVRVAVRAELKEGADLVKFMATGGIATQTSGDRFAAQLSREELAAGVAEARKAGRKAAAHAEGHEGIMNALVAGVDSIEHGSCLSDEAVDLMARQKTVYVPTFAVRDRIVKEGRGAGVPDFIQTQVERAIETHAASVQRAHRAGITVAMGTDAGATIFPHGQSAQELAAYVRLGFSPMEALVTATRNAAELLGLGDHLGTIEATKLADLIVVDGDPLADIAILTQPSALRLVLIGGISVLDRDAIFD